MKIFVVFAMIALAVDARSFECEDDKIMLQWVGVCSLQSTNQEACLDMCDGSDIIGQEECAMMPECCWNGKRCNLKKIPAFVMDDNYEYSGEAPDNKDDEKINLSRAKRQSGSVKGSIEGSRNEGWTASGEYNKNNRDGSNVNLGGSVHAPSGHWNVRGGYERPLGGGRLNVGVGYGRGDRGPTYGISWSKRWGRRK